MAMKACLECQREISTDAVACPHCGKRHPTGGMTRGAKIGLGIIVLVVLYNMMDTGGSSRSRSMSGSSSRAASNSAAEASGGEPTSGLTVSAGKLFAAYQANEVHADNLYKGYWLEVDGTVDGIKKDFADATYLTLETGSQFMPVRAELASSAIGRAASLSSGQQVRLLCKGKGMIVGSPILDDCRFR
jgi:tRNA_anti-like